jgi:hypothetical protein
LQVTIPNHPVLSLTSPAIIPSLNPGSRSSVSLSLTPSEDEQFGDFSGSLSVHNNITGVAINFRFYVVSDLFTQLTVYVEDEVQMIELYTG